MIPMFEYPNFRPYGNITPFSYRDGAQAAEVLEQLRHWIRTVLVPSLNKETGELAADYQEQVTLLITAINALIEDLNSTDNASEQALAEIQAIVAGFPDFDAIVTAVNAALAAVTSLAIGQPNGLATLDNIGKVPEAQMQTRLSQSSLDTRYGRKLNSPRSILAEGSSITQGIGASTPWPAQMQTILNTLLPATPVVVTNAGVSGNNTTEMLARLPALLASGTYGIVVLELSVNDTNTLKAVAPATTLSNMFAMADLVQKHGAIPIFTTTQTPNPAQYGIPSQITDSSMRTAAQNSVSLLNAALLHRIDTADIFNGLLHQTDVLADGVHPNEKGAGIWARIIADIILQRVPSLTAGTIYEDLFDQGDTIVSLGADWTPSAGTTWGRTSGNAYLITGGDGSQVTHDVARTAVDVSAIMGWASGLPFGGIIARGLGVTGYLLTWENVAAVNNLVLYRLNSGSANELGRLNPLTVQNGQEICLNIDTLGNMIAMFNGLPLFSAKDTVYTGTRVGLRASSNPTSARWANLKVRA